MERDLYYDWMIGTFHRRDFTTEGLCHVLRYLLFESRLRLTAFDEERARQAAILQFITARANRVACGVLRAGLDHIERTPLDRLRPDDELLLSLSQWEAAEEDRLMHDIAGYMAATEPVRSRQGAGGFDRSWTFGGTAREAAGIGAA